MGTETYTFLLPDENGNINVCLFCDILKVNYDKYIWMGDDYFLYKNSNIER